jgi:mannose-6-phosphate isomerase-like protein (cupin superfamily)
LWLVALGKGRGMDQDRRMCVHEDDVKSIRVSRKGSQGYLMVRRLMDPAVTGSQEAIVLLAEVPAHQSEGITPHYHRHYEETMYVAAGRGEFRVGDSLEAMESMAVRPGSCCYIPAEHYHELVVEGDEAMKLVISYFCISGEGGKSHQQIALELTNVPFQGAYGED